MTIKTYIILYNKDKNRVYHVNNNIVPILKNYQIINATDGKNNEYRDFLNSDSIVKVKPDLHKWRWTIRGQVACTLSHIRTWREIAKNNDQMAIVLEDDAVITNNFYQDINNIISELPSDFTFCYLYITPDKYQDGPAVQLSEYKYINRSYETFGTVGYIVSRRGTQDLLNDFTTIRQEIDQQIITKIKGGWNGVFTAKTPLVNTSGQLTCAKEVTTLVSNVWDSLYFVVYDLLSFIIYPNNSDNDKIQKNLCAHLFNRELVYSLKSNTEISDFLKKRQITVSPNLSKSEIVQVISHIQTWERALELNLSDCAVVEPNMIAEHSFIKKIDEIRQELPDDYHFCYIYISKNEIHADPIPNAIYTNYGYPYSTICGYIISRNGIKELLQEFKNISQPFDEQIIHLINHRGLKYYTARNSVLELDPNIIPFDVSSEIVSSETVFVSSVPRIGKYIIGKDIDEIVCINLDHRTDRRDAMLKEFKDYPFIFYTALKHHDPVRGCLESHINVIKYARDMGYKNILILEDDLKIVKDLKLVPTFPDNWDMIYFGGLCTHVMEWGDPWIRGHIYCDQAYLINSRLFDKIIEEGWKYDGPLDKFYTAVIHPVYNCYTQRESNVVQTEGWSDIDTKHKWKDFKWPRVGEMFHIP